MKNLVILTVSLIATSAFAIEIKSSGQVAESLLCSIVRMEQKVSQIEIPLSDFIPATDTNPEHYYCGQIFDIDYTDWNPMDKCKTLLQAQRVRVCEYNAFNAQMINIRYTIGTQGFNDDPSSSDGTAPYIGYNPAFQVQSLENGTAANMSNSDFAPAYGPNIDVVCVIGDQQMLDAETAKYEAKLTKNRLYDYDKAYNDRKQACSNH